MESERQKTIVSIKSFWTEYEYKIILIIGFLLVALISFEFGYRQASAVVTSPIIIEKPIASSENSPEGQVGGATESKSTTTPKAPTEANSQATTTVPLNCAFVGSKNSDKFYPPSCSYAKRIKPENIVCFATAQEALAQGRTASTGCK